MTKKKVSRKKTKKKVVRKKATRRKAEPRGFVTGMIDRGGIDRGLRIKLFAKLMAVCDEITQFEASRNPAEGSEGIEFGYTRAAEVLAEYGRAFRAHRLHWRPIHKQLHVTVRQVFITVEYELTDVDTGYSIRFTGIGQGNNGVWAVNSAQTVALKQALLEMGMVYWEEPPEPERESPNPWDYQDQPHTAAEAIEALGEFFANYKAAKAAADDKKRRKQKS
ncbi:MAG: hypothetical protein AMJ65_08190 [Phycisphaerae bacterium SG8_4]|nr:MAG: hypothetical protein AMJ65_08190 [Phycisphaerae bacterium SG8_4]